MSNWPTGPLVPMTVQEGLALVHAVTAFHDVLSRVPKSTPASFVWHWLRWGDDRTGRHAALIVMGMN